MNKKETLNDVYHEVIEPNQPINLTYSNEESLDNSYYEKIDNEELEKSNPYSNKKTLVVNLFAGPGSGKSTTAAGIFFELKSRGINCELVTEFVKDLVWEERHKAIGNQIYIFAKQHHRITRLLGEVDVIITDSPLLLTKVYDVEDNVPLMDLALQEHNKHKTLNVFIKRLKEFNPKGRMQSYDEARQLDRKIATMLDNEDIPYSVCFGNSQGKDIIVCQIFQLLGKE